MVQLHDHHFCYWAAFANMQRNVHEETCMLQEQVFKHILAAKEPGNHCVGTPYVLPARVTLC